MPRPAGPPGVLVPVPSRRRTDDARSAETGAAAASSATTVLETPLGPLAGLRLEADVAARLSSLLELRRHAGDAELSREVALTPEVSFGPRGFHHDGRHTTKSAGVSRPALRTLTAAARAICDADRNPFAKTTTKVRAAALDHVLPFLLYGRDRSRRPSSVEVKSRAAGFALLSKLAPGMVTKGEAKQRSALYDVLLDAAAAERHAGLKRQMLLGLDSVAKRELSGAQVRRRNALVEALHPSSPPYDAWFGAASQPKLNVVQYVQDEFWKGELSNYKKHGFDVKVTSSKRAVATKLMQDPSGEHPAVRVRVELENRDEAVLEAMGRDDVHAVFYTGHAQLGGVATTSLDVAPASDGSPKLLAFFACRTKQSLSALQNSYPDAHVLVSNQGTYGHDDRIVIQEIWKGVAARASYAGIEKAAEARALWEPDNYIFPGERDALPHKDNDRDGRADVSGRRRDVLFDTVVRRGPGRSISFAPSRAPKEAATLDGQKVTDAVQWFNTEWHYFTESFGDAKETERADRFRADGWFSSDDKSELLRVEEVRAPGQEPVWRVKINAAYAHQDPHAIAMMVTYELSQKIFAETRSDESDHDRRMKSLALVCSYLVNVQTFSDTGDLLLRGFAKRYGFPSSLSFDVAWTAVTSDPKDEASPKVVDKLERGMQFPFLEVNEERSSVEMRKYVEGALRYLRASDSEVARVTFDLIVSGRVKIDELSDLSRHDFLKLRKELVPSGIDLSTSDFLKLHDENSRAARAIRDAVDGYMWDDRIYVAKGLSPKALARTLAHEVNHVLNRSEESYRSKDAIFIEEYRAHVAELLVDGEELTPAKARQLKLEIITSYGLTGVDPDAYPDEPSGRFAPEVPS